MLIWKQEDEEVLAGGVRAPASQQRPASGLSAARMPHIQGLAQVGGNIDSLLTRRELSLPVG